MHVDTWRMHTAEVVVPLSDDFVETLLGDCTHISTSCMPVYRRAAASAWRLTQAQQSRRKKPWSEKEAKRVKIGGYYMIDGSMPHHGPAPGATPRLGMYVTVHTPCKLQTLYDGRVTTALGEDEGQWGVRNLLQEAVQCHKEHTKTQQRKPQDMQQHTVHRAHQGTARPLLETYQADAIEAMYGEEARQEEEEGGLWERAGSHGILKWDELMEYLRTSWPEAVSVKQPRSRASKRIRASEQIQQEGADSAQTVT